MHMHVSVVLSILRLSKLKTILKYPIFPLTVNLSLCSTVTFSNMQESTLGVEILDPVKPYELEASSSSL